MIVRLLVALLLAGLSAAVWFFGPRLGLVRVDLRIVVMALLCIPPLLWLLWRYIRAARSARSLERALEHEAAAQAARVVPDRRDEIQALNREFQKALRALRSSRLGRGRRGNTALYALPWYMIVGPPATGKSTALLASGLNFPYTPAHGKGIRGIGGTRNCDWWFTDEAILLDTAGRYMTEDDDREEWLAFVQMLKRHRRRKPLNGVIIAVAITDLLDADEERVSEMASRLRERIDEVMGKLELSVPAYVLVTKLDLLRGFVEFFADLGKAERGQIWGFTLPLGEEEPDPRGLFEEELDLLLESLSGRMFDRLAREPQIEDRELAFQFPMQVRAARRNLGQFVGELFQANPYQESPVFRGVYFTSGTQEGRPIDRVMGEMARAFGLRERSVEEMTRPRAERKSYFLRELFTDVIFPDQDIAGKRARDVSRGQRIGRTIAGASLGVGLPVLVSGLMASRGNYAMHEETRLVAEQALQVPWEEPDRTPEDFDKLERLRARLVELERWSGEGPPLRLGLGMYAGGELVDPVRQLYRAQADKILMTPVREELERTLSRIGGSRAPGAPVRGEAVETLKAYLMLSDASHLDRPFLTRALLPVWKDTLRQRRSLIGEPALLPHLETVVAELGEGKFAPLPRDERLVAQVRAALQRMPEEEALLSAILSDASQRIAAFELRDALGTVQTVMSASGSVPGCFTRAGWDQHVRRSLEQAKTQLDRNAWVLADVKEDGKDARREALRQRYFEQYSAAWKKFLGGISIRPAVEPRDALRDLETLTQDNPPHVRLLKEVVYQTSIPAERSLKDEVVDRARERLVDAGPAEPVLVEPLGRDFARLRGFVGQPGAKGDAPLLQYVSSLGKLRDALREMVDGGNATKLSEETRAADDLTKRLLLETLDDQTRSLLRGLLEQPIANVRGSALQGAQQSIGRGWQEEVATAYERSIANRYPFVRRGPDASLADVSEFLREGGILWTHYQQKLASLVPRSGHQFRPAPAYEKVFGADFLRCLRDASVWTAALFPPGAQAPLFAFEVRPQPVGRGVGELMLDIDGQVKTYRNTPEERWPFQWPGTGRNHGVRLVTRGAAGIIDVLEFPGEWGLFHFVDAAKMSRTPGGFSFTWSLKHGSQVRLDFKPARSQNPLADRPALACPHGVR